MHPFFNAKDQAVTNPYKLTQEEHDSIYRLIEARYLPKSIPQDRPLAIITGGQPGSGKSGLATQAKTELAERGGYVLIDADKLRTFSPLYRPALLADDREAANLTHPDASSWAQRLTLAAAQGRRNLLIDQTSKDPAALVELASRLQGAGYRVELRAMAVNERVSEQRIYTRYEQQKAIQGHGRFSTKANHDAAYVGVARAVQAVELGRRVDALSIYDKNHNRISHNTLEAGEWTCPMTASSSLQGERGRALTLEERTELADQYGRLRVMLERPERAATAAERETLSALHASAVHDLKAVSAMVDRFRGVADLQSSPAAMPSYVREGTVLAVSQRHAELSGSATAERIARVALEDLQDFRFLDGTPEQASVALAMRPLMHNPTYRAAVIEVEPGFHQVIEAAELARDLDLSAPSIDMELDP